VGAAKSPSNARGTTPILHHNETLGQRLKWLLGLAFLSLYGTTGTKISSHSGLFLSTRHRNEWLNPPLSRSAASLGNRAVVHRRLLQTAAVEMVPPTKGNDQHGGGLPQR
jgi:hypothetical protein